MKTWRAAVQAQRCKHWGKEGRLSSVGCTRGRILQAWWYLCSRPCPQRPGWDISAASAHTSALFLHCFPAFRGGTASFYLATSHFPSPLTMPHYRGSSYCLYAYVQIPFYPWKTELLSVKQKFKIIPPTQGIQCTFLTTVHDRGAVNFPLCDQILQLFAFLPLGSNFFRKAFHNPTK